MLSNPRTELRLNPFFHFVWNTVLQGQQFKGKLTRFAWSLNKVTRTLRTEIDLENPELPEAGHHLRPGMYAHATIEAEWPDVLTLQSSAIATEGDVNIGYQS